MITALTVGEFLLSLPAEIYVSLLIVFVIFIIGIIVSVKVKRVDPLAKPKGLLLLIEIAIAWIDNLLLQQMGKRYKGLGGYFLAVAFFLVFGFLIGLLGLPSPMGYYMVPLTFGIFTFVMLHANAIKTNKWRYFHRYIEPFPPFLPVNLLSMWAPIISLSFRMFCNALAGWAIMSIVYSALGSASAAIFSFLPNGLNTIFIAPFIASWLHLYFDLFTAAIQTLVFITLSMIFIASEGPSDEEETTTANEQVKAVN